MELADESQRKRALEPFTSFIIQAPAGSGKTELLVQRFLVLLTQVEQAPEEIVAITFTRKAAAEMRERILQALQLAADTSAAYSSSTLKTQQLARAVLQRDKTLNWGLLHNPNRLRITTIDALCLSIVRQVPLLANLGTQPVVMPDADQAYQQAARTLLQNLAGNEPYAKALETVLSHLDNHFGTAELLFIDMLKHRDQWLPHVLHALATKNNAELRSVLQRSLVNIIEERLQLCQALFPPQLQTEFLNLVRYAASLLSENHPLASCGDLQELPAVTLSEQMRWSALAQFLLTQKFQWRKTVTQKEGFPGGKNPQHKAMKQAMLELLTELQHDYYEEFRQALQAVCEAPPAVYSDAQWQVVDALIELLPVLAAQLQLVFQERGSIDFAAVATAAIQALGEPEAPSQLALHLDYQIRHLLVDEFQDTSLTQFRLLELLTAGWQADEGRTLFLVGDPMQSIYRFRQAEVGLFLRAQQQGIGSIQLEPLVLSTNFRSSPQIVNWINQTFMRVFPKVEDIAQGAVRYSACVAAKPEQLHDGVTIYPLINASAALEAAQVLQIIAQRQQRCPNESIGILVRSRAHLQAIIPVLQQANLPFQAVEIEQLYQHPIVDDLLALTRALFHLADRTAWLAILRAPWCGLGLADLHLLANQQPEQTLWEMLNHYQERGVSQEGQQRLQRCLPILNAALQERSRSSVRQWVEGTWWALGGPACVEKEQSMHYAQIYFALLDELSKNNPDLDFNLLNQKIQKKYATPPQAATAAIQIMTIHKAKGLEFDTVILPGLEHCQRQQANRLLLWMERPRPSGDTSDLVLAPIHTAIEEDPIYRYLRQEQQKKDKYELGRLLYVAATRARKSLHLLGTVQAVGETVTELRQPIAGSFLEMLWPVVQQEFKNQPQMSLLATAAQPATLPRADLYRLTAAWQMPSLVAGGENIAVSPAILEIEAENQEADPVTRLVGTLVHQTLQRIGQEGLAEWNEKKITAQRKLWRRLLLEKGLPLAKLETALQTIANALTQTLQDNRGRWLLADNHQDAHSEYSLTLVLRNSIAHLVIDRTFVSADGTRWIIDYKTAAPNSNESIEVFLDSHQKQYAAQLTRYAQAMRAKEEQRPIRLGLYFPLCGGWREWAAEVASNII